MAFRWFEKLDKDLSGQSLVELIVVMALMALMMPAMLTGMVTSREGRPHEEQRLRATSLLREAEEAVRSVRDTGWATFAVNGTYHPEISGSAWILVSGSEVIEGFTRQLVIADAQRDSNGDIVDSGGTVDASTKKITYSISWTLPTSNSIEFVQYLQRFKGNATLEDTTEADFDSGTHNNTTTQSVGDGAVELNAASGSFTYTDDYDTPGNYTYDSGKIEVTGGFAQLKSSGGSGSTTNSDFDTDATGWTFDTYERDVDQTGSRSATGGNPNGFVQVNYPNAKNRRRIAGGYWYQGFTTTDASPTANLAFEWKAINYDATPDSFHAYAYIDTGTGTPTTQVWDSGNITSMGPWSSTVNVDVSSYITSPGTYYLKMAVFVDFPTSDLGPLTVGFDNVLLDWTYPASYPTDEPPINPTASFDPGSLISWDAFRETANLDGGSIMYQLSDDDGATWQYYSGGWTEVVGATDYNDASTVNTNIGTFPTASGTIMVKAFLISDGSQFVQLDKVEIDYTVSGGGSSGDFTSASMDAGSEVSFNRIIWTENATVNNTVEFHIATNSDDASWNYVGPDGTSGTYFTGGSGEIPLSEVAGRYLRYKIYLSTTTGAELPNVEDVTINYSP